MTNKQYDLKAWRQADRKLVRTSKDPLTNRLLEAAASGEIINITYDGGSNPGASRDVLPNELFKVVGMGYQTYLSAYCYNRKEPRSFRLDLITLTNEKLPKRKRENTKRKFDKTSKRNTSHSGTLKYQGRTPRSSIRDNISVFIGLTIAAVLLLIYLIN